jgi:hypothetical protein
MSESKPFASLSPTLLARKGGAKPAMRPQWQPLVDYSAEAPLTPAGHELEDLGWNDMGDGEADAAPETTVIPFGTPDEQLQQSPLTNGVPEVVRQQDALAGHVEPKRGSERGTGRSSLIPMAAHRYIRTASRPPEPAAPVDRRSALAEGRRAAFTLRVDEARHLKLRLACTMQGRSAQQLVTQALDRLLDELPELDDLAKRVRRR